MPSGHHLCNGGNACIHSTNTWMLFCIRNPQDPRLSRQAGNTGSQELRAACIPLISLLQSPQYLREAKAINSPFYRSKMESPEGRLGALLAEQCVRDSMQISCQNLRGRHGHCHMETRSLWGQRLGMTADPRSIP